MAIWLPKRYFILVLLGASLLFPSFKLAWELLGEILVQAKDIQTDRLGNVYVITPSNQFTKYDSKGNLLSTLNYAYLGNISSVDASNPMELYLFYREMNSVVFLDNNLAFRGKINLSNAGVIQASAAARNYSNGLWVFDQGDLQLKKLDKDGKLVQASGNSLQFAQSKNLNPNYIYDNGSKVFVNDSAVGIMVFDVFANYLKTIPIKGLTKFKVIDEQLYYAQDGNLINYSMKSLVRDTLFLAEPILGNYSLEKEQLYLVRPDKIEIYRYNK
jgi:hypothetical protein